MKVYNNFSVMKEVKNVVYHSFRKMKIAKEKETRLSIDKLPDLVLFYDFNSTENVISNLLRIQPVRCSKQYPVDPKKKKKKENEKSEDRQITSNLHRLFRDIQV